MPSMYELCLMHARADRAMRVVVTRQLDTAQLTMMEWLALAVVAEGPREGLSMSQIAIILDVTLPQVTALVSSLLKMKLCKQKVLITDRRGRQVIATLKGKRTVAKLEETISKAMRTWSKDIAPDDMSVYIETVKALARKDTD